MDCGDFQKFVHVFLDGELDARDQGEIAGHLRSCASCREQAQFQQAFRGAVRRALPPEPPPPYLEARVRARLAEAVANSRWAFLRALAVPAAATVAVGGLAAYVWLRAPEAAVPMERGLALENGAASPRAGLGTVAVSPSSAPSRTAGRGQVVQATAQVATARESEVRSERAHRPAPPRVAERARVQAAATGDRDLGIQFASTNLRRVKAFLESRLDTSLRVPEFRGHARVVGGSASLDDATAQVVYRHKNDHIYVHIRPRNDPTLPARGIVLRQENGHRVAAWQHDGLTFSMTSRLDPVEMVRLVATELNDTVRRERPARPSVGPPEPLFSPGPTPDIRPASMSVSD